VGDEVVAAAVLFCPLLPLLALLALLALLVSFGAWRDKKSPFSAACSSPLSAASPSDESLVLTSPPPLPPPRTRNPSHSSSRWHSSALPPPPLLPAPLLSLLLSLLPSLLPLCATRLKHTVKSDWNGPSGHADAAKTAASALLSPPPDADAVDDAEEEGAATVEVEEDEEEDEEEEDEEEEDEEEECGLIWTINAYASSGFNRTGSTDFCIGCARKRRWSCGPSALAVAGRLAPANLVLLRWNCRSLILSSICGWRFSSLTVT
jgi:hypothetical protein